MRLFNRLLDNPELTEHKRKIDILSPVSGSINLLDSASNLLFKQRLFGEGVVIAPTGFQILAPFDAIVLEISETAHRVRLKDRHGLKLQIHCGWGAQNLNGEGFKRKVVVGQKLKLGQPILDFDARKLKLALEDNAFYITLLNSDKVKGLIVNPRKVTACEDPVFSVLI
ncbi:MULTISPECIES: PTS sugar transporter subunit IIA [Alteromonadaceae]|uniref:PTS sugar transporter subunit IIA n=1 Tax=Alteromonadaceae TaxID=72275 RepID=UPI001C089B27|nr:MULTISPECIES: PTS glucose transporter subunit IIA [Aliiglaciecola]MBU2877020.1 PTS glucose transporter subunit IIA [Aliiglaciecola lipolytica]MDO6712285.1 PTS glucose transporter subunit IIA [Aliiglaciecola sp. 2_MG-2023]MDO6753309.1 PTS glucose transporter subunit IIA [Aliiglaciecola sp. 1_MG-2023]